MNGSVSGVTHYKYPSTCHLSWSPEKHRDDSYHPDESTFEGEEVVVLEKMDGENCVDGGSIVMTEDGKKTIKEICEEQYDGRVRSYDTERGEVVWDTVDGWFVQESENDEWYELETENGEVIKLTGDHRVYLPDLDCYRRVDELNGDEKVVVMAED